MIKTLLLPIITAVLDWLAVHRKWKTIGYFTKPLAMLVLLGWLISQGISGHLVWFAVGVGFSMLGDIFLMLPNEQFISGLLAFLFGHLAYIIGLNTTAPPVNLAALLVALMVGVSAGRLFKVIIQRVPTKLRIPVIIYGSVISLMLLSALLTIVRQNWGPQPSLMVGAGALLFFVSDATLAWNRFVHPLKNARLKVRITYHIGQILLVSGAVIQFLGFPTLF